MAEQPKAKRAKITDFQPDPANPNKGSERGYRMLNDSLRKLGAGRSIVVDKNGYVIAGNKTQENAVDIGLEDAIVIPTDGKQIVVVQRTDLDLLNDPDHKARQLSIADNRTSDFMEWDAEVIQALVDQDINLSDWFQQDELAELLAGLEQPMDAGNDPGADVDRAGELQQKWQTARGQVWEVPSLSVLGRCHRVMCGDSTSAEDVARLMGGEKAEMALSDPPYKMQMGGGYSFLSASTENMKRRVAPLADFTVDQIEAFKGLNIPTWYLFCSKELIPDYLRVFDGYTFNILFWGKTNPTPFTNGTFLPDVEYVMFFSGKGRVWNNSITPMDTYSRFYLSAKLEGREDGGGEDYHPTMKPVELCKRYIRISSNEAGIVTDPFLGSGTTLVACEQTGRIGYGMEIAPEYVAVILERLSGMGLAPRVVETTTDTTV